MNHYKTWISLALFVLNVVKSQETIAVLDFEGINFTEEDAKALTNRFSSEFLKLSEGRYIMIERQQMEEISKEQGFQMSGCVASDCAVEIGNALGAKFVIVGSISKIGSIFSINARTINIETTEIINSIDYDYKGNINNFLTKKRD